ncbi:MAG: phytase [Actinomycetota bacterium]|jgi:myo-inositol-hexaphosphate 3-phosphohydrolase
MDGATRIWLDDPNPIFRMGLAASLRDPRFIVVGESAGFVPPPALENVDVLVFDLGEQENLGLNLGSRLPELARRHRRSTRLVGLVPGGDPQLLERSQCTILVRSELTPEGFRDCLASVAAEAPAPAVGSAGRSGSAQDSSLSAVRAALAGAGGRLRRVMRRKGALFVVVAALAAGAFGPTGRAEGLSGSTDSATPTAETTPVMSDGDAAGDVAVWVNSADPGASLVLGTDKSGALESYGLDGQRVQRLSRPPGTVSSVDVRNGFSLGGRTVALVGTGGRIMSFFRLDGGRQLREVTARDFPTGGPQAGLCLYRSAVSGRFYAFVTQPRGDVTQYELFDQGGSVDAREVRSWPLSRPARTCVADDETGRLFVSEADAGIWRYRAEPDASPIGRHEVDKVGGGGHLASGVAGLAVVAQPGRRGYLLASSPGDNTFAIYERRHDHRWLGQREVVDGADADGCSATTGIEAVAAGLGPDYPAGLFVCQDGRNTAPGPAGRQNFKYVRLERLLDTESLPAS